MKNFHDWDGKDQATTKAAAATIKAAEATTETAAVNTIAAAATTKVAAASSYAVTSDGETSEGEISDFETSRVEATPVPAATSKLRPRRSHRSPVWNYFTKLSLEEATCDICQAKLLTTCGNTTGLRNHLKILHTLPFPFLC